MPAKRGRPISSDIVDLAQERRREAWRRRQQRRRQEETHVGLAGARRHTAAAVPQLSQGEQIVSLTPTEEESAAATLLQLGLRVQNLTLPQDPGSVRLQQEALDVDEHTILYPERQTEEAQSQQRPRVAVKDFFSQFATSSSTSVSQVNIQGQSQLPQYFRTLPAEHLLRSQPSGHSIPSMNVSALSSQHQRPCSSEHSDSATSLHHNDMDINTGVLNDSIQEGRTASGERAVIDPEEDASNNQDLSNEQGNEQMQREVPSLGFGSEDLLGQDQMGLTRGYRGSDRSDAESEVDFVSQRSVHSDTQSDIEEESPQQYMGRKLYEQLQGGFHGCTDGEHREGRSQHMNDAGNNHHSLGNVFNDRLFPSVLGLQEMLSPERLARQQRPTPAQWEAMFCGIPTNRQQRQPMNVCLHDEETQAVEPEVAFDIDSFLGFADSLAFARKGLWYQPAPQMRQNMTTDVHLETNAFASSADPEQPVRSRLAMLRDVPHFLLGRVTGAHDITLFVLFPHIHVAGDKFKSLTHEQLSRWTDKIYLPAIHKFFKAHYTQHIPASFRNAYDNSKAHQVEGRQVQTSSYQAQQSVGYHLQPEHLDEIWRDVLHTIDVTPGLADFREPELFFSAKGTKLQFKTGLSRPGLLDAMEYFKSYLEDVLDFDFVQQDRFYVDLGKEICANISLAQPQQQQIGDEAQVYLWKRCCLERYIEWMYEDQAQRPKKGTKGQLYFTQNMLYEAGSLTSVAPKRSIHRQGGLIYSQFYSSVKELYDATKCFPFTNDAMEELALDPQIRNAARNTAGGNRRDAKIVESGYLASKRRTSHALQDARRKSFGIREEHRIGWHLFLELVAQLRSHDDGRFEVTMNDCPSYAWAVKTDVYLDFLWRSADKFATGFEVVRALSRPDLVTWEQTKMMVMFLRCLRYVFGGHLLSQESALWWSRRERAGSGPVRVKMWYGLGFRNTLPGYKYCWLEPRIDWGQLQFKSEVTDDMLFGNNVLRGQYLRRGGQVQAFFDTTRRLDLALEWLDTHMQIEMIKDRVISWIVHICLQQFRVDVLNAVSREIVAERREEVIKGEEGFSFEYLNEVMIEGCYLMSGNKTDFKQASDLVHFLFDWDDGLIRQHWEDRAFRVLYRRARIGLRQRGGAVEAVFMRRFWRWIYKYHWVLPYPCSNALLQTTKQGRRMWYSVKKTSNDEQESRWKWGRKDWEVGGPETIPHYIGWGKEEWERWIERQVRVSMVR